MKKSITTQKKEADKSQEPKAGSTASLKEIRKRAGQERLTIELYLGDRHTHYCIVSEMGEVLIEDKLRGRASKDQNLPVPPPAAHSPLGSGPLATDSYRIVDREG